MYFLVYGCTSLHIHSHTTHACTPTHAHTLIHTHIYTHIHNYTTYTHIRTHICTHSHIHTPLCRQFSHLLHRVKHDGDINTSRPVEHLNQRSHFLSGLRQRINKCHQLYTLGVLRRQADNTKRRRIYTVAYI